MSDRLAGRTALITGGTTGIGFATAKLFLAEGARVAITGQNPTRIEQARIALGPRAAAMRSDARRVTELPALALQIGDIFGQLDVLFLNAGISPYGDLAGATETVFDEIFAVNTKSVFFLVQHLVPFMKRGASIIVTTSITNRIGMARTHIYAASKAASASFVRTLAGELAERGIRVNALSPGPVSTEVGGSTGLSPTELQAVKDAVTARVPMHRFAHPDELATAALFLASADSLYMTGQEIVVDGGWIGVGG
jgi:NAD(P)-dependent dehydrogenase (short-subunit alcohol dehydrogenase family)